MEREREREGEREGGVAQRDGEARRVLQERECCSGERRGEGGGDERC